MNKLDTTVEIQTLGRFNISVNGTSVATDWPEELVKILFCSLLSPLNLYFTWDRISRSMLGVRATQTSRRRLEEKLIGPLNRFLIGELGFSPLITGPEGIKIDYQRIHVDAFEFHINAVDGLKLLSHGNLAAAFEKFSTAKSLYNGSYLPGIPGRIIANTRVGLESLHQTAIMDAMPLARKSICSGRSRRAKPVLHLRAAGKPAQMLNYGHDVSI